MAAEATTISATDARTQSPRQFQDVFSGVIPFTFTATEASIASAAASVGNVTVPGATPGDFVLVASETDVADVAITAQVTAANTVTFEFLNLTGGAITAFSGGIKINGVVLKAGHLFD